MLGRTRILLAAVCAVVSFTAVSAFAEEVTTSPQAEKSPAAAPEVAPEAPAPKPLLMSGLNAIGVGQPLQDVGINIYGYVQGSYTYNASNPTDNFNFGRVFDVDNQEVLLNQWDLTFQRTVDPTKKSPDIGFTVEWIYGADSRFLHSNGLDFYGPGDVASGPQLDPENQFDLSQAFVDVVPVQNVLVRAGKFYTFIGYETINPNTTPFYSHSYQFGFGIPFYQTGALVYWNVTDKLTVMGGITRGWEQSTKDNNDVIDGVGQVKYLFTDKLVGYFNFVVGPEKSDNNGIYRSLVEGIVSYAITDKFSVAGDGIFGWEGGNGPGADETALWYGIAAYASYKINEPLTANLRAEWFDDDDGSRGFGTTLWEGTAGVTITPFPGKRFLQDLKFRPEVRWDYASDPVFDGQNSQFTAAIDAIFNY